MKDQTVTIKTECFCIQEHARINKVLATINAKNLAKLIDVVGLTANPRKSKKNKVTTAICETLKTSPEDFRFKSKGMLISSSSCIQRERGRFTLSFEDESYEGVLDGGHNMLAVGLFILEEYFGEDSNKQLSKVKNWDTFIELWHKNKENLSEVLDVFEFEMPIEIIYPTTEYNVQFPDAIFEISDARNNNSPLSSGTKADHKGYYEILKNALDEEIVEDVEWKDGTGKRIKREDIVAMSLIPLLALQNLEKLDQNLPHINPVLIYSSKAKCVEIFSLFFEKYSDNEGKINDKLFLSAMSLLREIPRLYDIIYENFPKAYNNNFGKFGRMDCVKIYDENKKGSSYLSRPPLTKYYQKKCGAKYPEGFIIPIFAALSELMEVEGDKLKWKMSDPLDFIEKNLSKGVELLVNNIKDNNYNPNQVGKSKGPYDSMKVMFKLILGN